MTRDEQAWVCAEFALGEPLHCEPLGGTRNQNFLLRATHGSFVVRDRYVGYRDPARVAFDHAALAFLHQRGVSVVPPVRSTSDATSARRGDRLWEVFPAVSGRHFREGDAFDVRAVGEDLAAFHRAGKEFSPLNSPQKLDPRGETDPSELLDLTRKLTVDAPTAVTRYKEWATAASAELSDEIFVSLPHTLVHGDIQPANILLDDGGVRAFVDLDWCAWRPRVYDLAFAILFCCATRDSPIDGGDIWSLTQPPAVKRELIDLFLQSYAAQGWPLLSAEINALQPQVMLSWCHCRLAGAMKVDPVQRREFLERPPTDLAALLPDSIT